MQRLNIPVPDPSSMTTEQLRHELMGLRQLVETRLDGMDKAAGLLQMAQDRTPSEISQMVGQLQELHSEKFFSIQKQFDERDIRTRASEVAAQTAVNAALSAQKEAASAQNDANAAAIMKSEASTVKQIDGIVALLTSGTKATDDKIAAINARLDRGEGTGSGRASSQSSMLAVTAIVVSVVVGGVSVVSTLRPSAAVAPVVVATPPQVPVAH
jgi:ATP-dependent Clp protease ATP-binding subunit ClpA